MTPHQAAALATALIAQHGLVGWSFRVDSAKTRRGCCDYRKRTISVSRHLLPLDEAGIRNTLLHEIAHALVGPRHNHDDVWRAKARSIGCTGDRCGASMGVEPRFTAECGRCRRVYRRHRRPRHSACPCTRSEYPRPELVWRA